MADAIDPFVPDACQTAISEDGQFIRLILARDSDGATQSAFLRRTWIPQLLAELQSRIAPGQAVPINRGSLQLGTNYRLQGFQGRRDPDGSAVLTLAIDLTDQGRVVTLTADLSPREREDLIRMLGGQP